MRASSHSIWINRTSLRLHIISKFHLDALKKAEIDAGRRAEIEQTRAADMQRVQQMQAQFAAVNHLDLHLPQSRPSKNPPDATPQEQEMWEAFDAGETFDVSAGQNPGSRDEARLLYQLDNLDDWHLDPFSGGFDFASGVDETLTNVLQNMNMGTPTITYNLFKMIYSYFYQIMKNPVPTRFTTLNSDKLCHLKIANGFLTRPKR